MNEHVYFIDFLIDFIDAINVFALFSLIKLHFAVVLLALQSVFSVLLTLHAVEWLI